MDEQEIKALEKKIKELHGITEDSFWGVTTQKWQGNSIIFLEDGKTKKLLRGVKK